MAKIFGFTRKLSLTLLLFFVGCDFDWKSLLGCLIFVVLNDRLKIGCSRR